MMFSKLLRVGFVLGILFGLQSCVSEPMVPEGCITGVLTADGDSCPTINSNRSNKVYSFYADMNGYSLGEEICVCGRVAQMTTCKVGQTIEVIHLARTCPAPSSKSSQFTFPFD